MKIQNLTLTFGTQTIFDDINILLPETEKVGITGANGAGKTTFFRILLKQVEPDHGTVTLQNTRRISWLPQIITDEIPNTDMSVFDFLLSGRPIHQIEEKIKNLYLEISTLDNEKEIDQKLKKVGLLQEELNYWDVYEAESILLKLIDGMHIEDSLLDQPLKTLSGGQKSKVAFARLLYSKPELILLDEPTNHLDHTTKDFIIQYLKNYQGGIFVISHDIDFLNKVTTNTLYLDKQTHKMELFKGNYEQFQRIKKEREKTLLREKEKQDTERKKLEEIIARYIRGNEKKARIAKDRQKKLARLEENKIVLEEKGKEIHINLTANQESTRFPIRLENVSFRYDKTAKRDIIHKLTLEIPRGEKFLIIGENGVGKSTLLKLIMGSLQPDSGKIILGPKTDLGYYAQEHELLDENKTVLENIANYHLTSKQDREILGKFLFQKDDLDKKVSILSPGERARLSLAKLTLEKANVLILDEPTNHLDPTSQQLIAKAFHNFEGTMIIVSHNPEFVDTLGINRTLLLPDGKLGYYDHDQVAELKRKNESKK